MDCDSADLWGIVRGGVCPGELQEQMFRTSDPHAGSQVWWL